MITIKKNKITMTRGDTLAAVVSLTNAEGETYTPEEGDSIRFALKHPAMNAQRTEYTDAEPLITKAIPIDTLVLRLDPADTKQLGFGEYVYDIQITLADGTVDTFIAEQPFTLTPEVD